LPLRFKQYCQDTVPTRISDSSIVILWLFSVSNNVKLNSIINRKTVTENLPLKVKWFNTPWSCHFYVRRIFFWNDSLWLCYNSQEFWSKIYFQLLRMYAYCNVILPAIYKSLNICVIKNLFLQNLLSVFHFFKFMLNTLFIS